MKREGGYTLVEIGLVMAVSAGLLLIAGSLYVMSGNQRFTDSLQTTRAFIQQQYNDVRSGVSQRISGDDSMTDLCKASDDDGGSSAGNSKNCFVMGKLIQFRKDKMVSSYVVGYVDPTVYTYGTWPDRNKTVEENLDNMRLYAITGTGASRGIRPSTKIYPNGNELAVTLTCNGASCGHLNNTMDAYGNFNKVLILHSPLDGSMIAYVDASLDSTSDDSRTRIISRGSSGDIATGLVLALTSGGSGVSTGSICVPIASTSSGIQTAAPADGLKDNVLASDATKLGEVCNGRID